MNINKYLTTEGHMTVAEGLQWHFSHKSRLMELAMQVPGLAERFTAYANSVTAFDAGFKFPASLPETPELAELNAIRKRQAILIIHLVKSNMNFSCNMEVRVAATAIYRGFLKAYEDMTTLSYEADTAAITSFIEESETPVYQPHVVRLHLKEHIDELKAINPTFQTMYEKRYDTIYARRQSGKLTELKIACDKAFGVVVQILSGHLLGETDPAKLTILNEMAMRINATIAQFTRIVHQRLSLTSSSGNHQKPDISNPEVPEPTEPTDPQTPDITNPDITNPENPHTPDISNPDIPDFE